MCLARIATLASDHRSAADQLRRYCDELEQHRHRTYLSTHAPMLGRKLCALGQYDEAERLARQGRELGTPDDVHAYALAAGTGTRPGPPRRARRAEREAVELAERTDALGFQGDALCDLAEVLEAAGRLPEAAEALEQALEHYAHKQNLAMVGQVQPRLEALQKTLSTSRRVPQASRR